MRGHIWYQGRDLLRLVSEEMRRIKEREVALILQDAGSALNPVISIGRWVEEMMLAHTDMGKHQTTVRAGELLTEMGIADAKQVLDHYSFQLSGDMAQRVMLAMGPPWDGRYS